jgi:hypothetical protein
MNVERMGMVNSARSNYMRFFVYNIYAFHISVQFNYMLLNKTFYEHYDTTPAAASPLRRS